MAASPLNNENAKLGKLIHGWSITAGATCPGESLLCSTRCYAKHGHFTRPNVVRSHAQNYKFSRTPKFIPWMTASLVSQFVRVMRIHVAGDFYDPDYAERWFDICRRSPSVSFFAYTRSWRDDAILPALIRLHSLPNVRLWWSIDRETGPAPSITGIRTAYMAIDNNDAMDAPRHVDLIFRHKDSTPMKRVDGILVCPVENGVKGQHKHTCSTCGVCWRNGSVVTNLDKFITRVSEELFAPEEAA